MNTKPLLKTKTFWAAVVGIITAIGTGVTGDQEWATIIPEIATFACMIFFRQGLPKP